MTSFHLPPPERKISRFLLELKKEGKQKHAQRMRNALVMFITRNPTDGWAKVAPKET